jgi:hypothetical protein
MKKIFVPFLIIIALVAWLVPGAVQAAAGIVVSDSSAEVNFPASITFNIAAESDAAINDIRVHYTVERMAFAQVTAEVYVVFTPAKSVKTQYVWDMRKTGSLPPSTDITYWLTVTDSAGKKVETAPATIHFNDTRFDWKTIEQGQVTLYWYSGNDSFAADLMGAAQTALTRLADNTGAGLNTPVSIYIYGSQQDLLGAMIYEQDWAGGVAFSQYGIIAIGIETTQDQIDWGMRTIGHELTHLVEYQVTLNPYNYIPNWLSEGLAMYSEGPLELGFILALSRAEADNTFISVRSLCSPFPSDYTQTVLSYAESYKIVSYLIDKYGRDKMFSFLDSFKQGIGWDDALLAAYGFDMDELNSLWKTVPIAVYGS